jgi:hypothetical protein
VKVKRAAGAAALGAAAFALAACGGHGASIGAPAAHAPAGGWATSVELVWLRGAGVWQDEIVAAAGRIREVATQVNATAALLPLAHCRDTLSADVGPAPTPRLSVAARLFRRGCVELRRASIEILEMLRTRDTSKRAEARRRATHGFRLLRQGLAHLPPGELRHLRSGAPSASQSRTVPRFERVAARLASRPHVEVRCWSRRDWRRLLREEREVSIGRVDARAVGVTSLPAHRINLRGDVCLRLAALAAGRRAETEFLDAFALLVFAHESQHAAGVAAEATAECRGMQTMSAAGVLLGIPRTYAERLARDYWKAYPRQPRIYVSRACRDGGALDMRPASHRWP